MVKVYCYSKCTTCKKALKWLDDNMYYKSSSSKSSSKTKSLSSKNSSKKSSSKSSKKSYDYYDADEDYWNDNY